jgi:aminomethyltransferase
MQEWNPGSTASQLTRLNAVLIYARMEASTPLKRTPLYAAHVRCGGKIVPFAGWEMPVQYTGILEEHNVVRQHAGLFDISHMGEIYVSGTGAEAFLNRLLTNDLRKAATGQAQYTLLCNERGGIIDDLIAYRLAPEQFLLVINASHIPRDFAWIKNHAPAGTTLDNASDRTAAVALQGPASAQLLPEGAALATYHFQQTKIAGHDCILARTGYTGEDGFELIFDAGDAEFFWNELLRRGAKPCGLGARDTLRLEMCYPLHGNDLTEDTTPIEAVLGKFISLEKGDFIGRSALALPAARKLIAFKMTGKTPPPRPHYPILAGGRRVGEITSGTQSPTLGTGIGMGYVEIGVTGTIEIEIRGKHFPATIEKKPLLRKTL